MSSLFLCLALTVVKAFFLVCKPCVGRFFYKIYTSDFKKEMFMVFLEQKFGPNSL